MVIVAGVLMLRPWTLDELKPDMLQMIAASRAEQGCISYSYGVDLVDASVIRVYEEWESRGHLEAHFKTEHLKAWRRRIAEIGIVSRDIKAWDASSPVSI